MKYMNKFHLLSLLLHHYYFFIYSFLYNFILESPVLIFFNYKIDEPNNNKLNFTAPLAEILLTLLDLTWILSKFNDLRV